jgi:hypothetical protein
MNPMNHRASTLAAGAALLTALAAGGACSRNEVPAPGGDAAPVPAGSGDARPARVLPIPEAAGLPPGHPPLEAATGALVWDAPSGWVAQTPTSAMRRAQYRVPGPGGDGECVVFYFGPGQGGDPAANAARWAGQFAQPDGRPSVELMQVSSLEGAGREIRIVEVTGTYDGGMTMTDSPAPPKPGYMLLGAIAEGPDAPWFFKFTGPEATVRAQRDAFAGLLRSLRAGA